VSAAISLRAVNYEEERAAAVKRCEAIDPRESQSGLLFNPDGYRSYYVRSQCFQTAAAQFRDETLCAQVKQRRSLFSSSWGYSAAQCRELVTTGLAADQKVLEEIKRAYSKGAVKLRDFRIERNGNGRDFDIIPMLTGDYAHGYMLTFEILQPDPATAAVVLHASGYYLDATSNMRLYVRQADIRQRVPSFALQRQYSVRATVLLDVGQGGQSGSWSNTFIERVFPARERTQSITRVIRF